MTACRKQHVPVANDVFGSSKGSSMCRILMIVLLVAADICGAAAADWTISDDGTQWRLWEDHVAIICTITSVGDDGTYLVAPSLCIAGRLPVGRTLRFRQGPPGAFPIDQETNVTAIVLLQRTDRGWFVARDRLSYLPSGIAIAAGPDDPKARQLVERVIQAWQTAVAKKAAELEADDRGNAEYHRMLREAERRTEDAAREDDREMRREMRRRASTRPATAPTRPATSQGVE